MFSFAAKKNYYGRGEPRVRGKERERREMGIKGRVSLKEKVRHAISKCCDYHGKPAEQGYKWRQRREPARRGQTSALASARDHPLVYRQPAGIIFCSPNGITFVSHAQKRATINGGLFVGNYCH